MIRKKLDLLAIGTLFPMFAVWCLCQLWGQRRLLLFAGVLAVALCTLVTVWLLWRVVHSAWMLGRQFYLSVLFALIRRQLPAPAA